MPARKARMIVLRDRQNLIERLEQRSLAEPRRHDLVDDPSVEIIAGNREPGMADRGRGILVVASLKADQREIAGPTAEIADQNQRIGGQALGVVISGADRLVDIGRIKDADPPGLVKKWARNMAFERLDKARLVDGCQIGADCFDAGLGLDVMPAG